MTTLSALASRYEMPFSELVRLVENSDLLAMEQGHALFERVRYAKHQLREAGGKEAVLRSQYRKSDDMAERTAAELR